MKVTIIMTMNLGDNNDDEWMNMMNYDDAINDDNHLLIVLIITKLTYH